MEINIVILIIQVVIYISLIFILKKLYFDPILRLLTRRDAETLGREEQTLKFKTETGDLRKQYDGEMNRAIESMHQQRLEALKVVREKIEAKHAEAKLSAEKNLSKHRIDLDQEIGRIRAYLSEKVLEVSKEIVSAALHSRLIHL